MHLQFVQIVHKYSGWALGAGTALLGKEAAMACTVAVEATITDRYNAQIRELTQVDPLNYLILLTITSIK